MAPLTCYFHLRNLLATSLRLYPLLAFISVAAIKDPMEARRYLKHIGLPHDAPARAPPRSVQVEFEFEPFPDDLPD